MRLISISLLGSLAIASAADEIRLNQIQVIGSHNSYHVAPQPELLDKMETMNKDAKEWNYTHPPLAKQLDMGVRQFELDIFSDSKGGLFANPLGLKLTKLAGGKTIPFDPAGDMTKPGFKILHIPDLDFQSTAPTLKKGLGEMRAWSDKHPRHLPVMILLECKDQPQPPLPTKPEILSRELLLDLEKEILSVIPQNRILRPDDVRGKEATLRDGVTKHGWPTVDSLRGKFIFALDNTDSIRDRYLEGNPSLEGRVIFVSAPDAKDPAAAWFKCNDPKRQQDEIRSLVKEGFLVRTRTDTNKPNPEMKAKAFESGAQWVSTDHFTPDDPTRVVFKGDATVRGNPVSGDTGAKIKP